MSIEALILGGSRGLGLEISKKYESVVCSRKSKISIDLSKIESVDEVMKLVDKHSPKKIFYVAGGGPHGDFFSKPFHSHEWAFQVNYFTPIALAYALIEKNYEGLFVYIGSAIAERSVSDQSLSYSQSKKMTKQSLLSLSEKDLKVRLFSPPYMDTGMLTKHAWPRIEAPQLVIPTDEVANQLKRWLSNVDQAFYPYSDGSHKISKGNLDVRHFDWIEHFEYDIPVNQEF